MESVPLPYSEHVGVCAVLPHLSELKILGGRTEEVVIRGLASGIVAYIWDSKKNRVLTKRGKCDRIEKKRRKGGSGSAICVWNEPRRVFGL